MRKLVLFTANRYTSFVETEIHWLRKFQHESIIVTDVSNPRKDIYSETETVDFSTSRNLLAHFVRHFFELISILLADLFSHGTSWAYYLRTRQRLSTLLRCSLIELDLMERGVLNAQDIFYSYYANEFAIVLALAVKRKHIRCYSSRAHGRDVIEDREPVTKKLPFQSLKYQHAHAVYCVSQATAAYIQRKYPSYADKVNCTYLGTIDGEIGPIESGSEDFIVVSVGRVRNVKRFYLIAELLQWIDLPIRWIHIGDMAENDPTYPRFLESVQKLSTKTNIKVELKGFMDNADLLKFYQSNFVDVLINTSEIEGLPVSIQEAISFGIPCMATDVGGTSDIVNESTGVLLREEFSSEEGALTLSKLLLNKTRNAEFRNGVRAYWSMNFRAEINYPRFFSTLSAHGTFEG